MKETVSEPISGNERSRRPAQGPTGVIAGSRVPFCRPGLLTTIHAVNKYVGPSNLLAGALAAAGPGIQGGWGCSPKVTAVTAETHKKHSFLALLSFFSSLTHQEKRGRRQVLLSLLSPAVTPDACDRQ